MKAINKIISAILTASIMLSLVGCRKEDEPHKELEITENTPQPQQDTKKAEEVFYQLIEYYFASTTVQNLPENTKEEIKKVSQKLSEITALPSISTEDYSAFLSKISAQGKDVIDEILALEKEETASLERSRALYLDLCSILGSEYISSVLFDITVYFYDYRYTATMANYEKYGYSYLLIDAEELLGEKNLLVSDIGKEDFIAFLGSLIATAEIAFGKSADSLDAFSNEELLLFVQSINLSFDISQSGFEFLISRFSPLVTDRIWSQVISIMNENGDIAKVASIIKDGFSLLKAVQSNLIADDMAELRLGNTDHLLESAMSRFGDNEWLIIENIGKTEINSPEYETLFLKEYKEDFTDHVAGLSAVTVEDLRASVGTDKFYESLKDFIGGISPILSYGIEQ